MTATMFANQSANCCTAAACSSARICDLMDTAIALAVSIIICRIRLRLQTFA